jgi:MYXO-CTERM domain-containing protein
VAAECESDPKEGACCVDDTCEELIEEHCIDAGGTWFGIGTECVDYEDECGTDPDPDPEGACCVDDTCVDMTMIDCHGAAGAWYGVGVACSDVADECGTDLDPVLDEELEEEIADEPSAGCSTVADSAPRSWPLFILALAALVLTRSRETTA